MKSKFLLGTALLLSLLMIFTGCDMFNPPKKKTAVSVTAVAIEEQTSNLTAGQTLQLNAVVTPSNATLKTVTWDSDDPNIASVSETGLVTAVAAGEVTITVTTIDGNFSDSLTITVNPVTIAVTGVSIVEDLATLAKGSTSQLTAQVTPSNASDNSVLWASSDDSIATVSSSGLVTAKATGDVTITVTTNDGSFTDSLTLEVTQAVTSVAISEDISILDVDSTSQLTAVVAPSDASNKSVTWSSSDISKATVSADGLVTAVAPGDVTITVTTVDGSFTDSLNLTISQEAAPWIALGKTQLENELYDEAMNSFSQAVAVEPDNAEAVLYWSMMKIASITVADEVQSIVSDMGMTGYPETMTEMFTGQLETQEVYAGGSSSSSGGVIYEYEYFSNSLPSITVPDGYHGLFPSFLADEDLSNATALGDVFDPSLLTLEEYFFAILANLSENCPDGFTSQLQSVADLMDSSLSDVVSALDGLTASDTISMTAEMVTLGDFNVEESGWPIDNMTGEPMEIIIGKAEVLTTMASLQILASVIDYSASMDLSFPFSEIWAAFNPLDGTFFAGDTEDYTVLPSNPMGTVFQTSTEAATYLARAKAQMSGALNNLEEASGLLINRTASDDFFIIPDEQWGQEGMDILSIAHIVTTKLSDSLDNGTTIYLPQDMSDPFIYANESAWPTAADWSFLTDPATASPDTLIAGIDLSAVYDSPLFALDSLFEMDSNGEPVIYDENQNIVTEMTASQLAAAQATETWLPYGVKLNDITMGGFFDIDGASVDVAGLCDLMGFTLSVTQVGSSVYIYAMTPEIVFSCLNDAGTEYSAGVDITRTAYGSLWYEIFFGLIVSDLVMDESSDL